MKRNFKHLALILAFVFAFSMLAGCANSQDSGKTTAETTAAAETTTPAESTTTEETTTADPISGTLVVFAAASLTETLTKIGDMFMELHPDLKVVFTFDSSGTLKTQIEEGADVDIFISASTKQMNQLDISADPEVNKDGLDFVLADTRFDLLENKVVLAVPDGNPKGITSFDQLAELLLADDVLLAMGNEDVPVGQYTQKILEYYDIDEDYVAYNITYGSNVKEVVTQVKEATVDCGVVYATDAFSAGLDWVDEATKEMCGQVIYPAAVMNVTQNEEVARAFLEFLTTSEAADVFASVGFTPLS